jgi:apolipoprotein D and lipocalin family protein
MKMISFFFFLLFSACSSGNYMNTVDYVDTQRFMGSWYVLAGRFTFLETNVHNGVETYTWNEEKQRIDVDFTYNKGSFDGPIKSLPQKGWIYNTDTNAHWKVSPLWPFKFDYLIIDLDENYAWTAIGVPNQKYLWIMARDWRNPDAIILEAIKRLEAKGYNTQDIVRVPHQWP